MTDAAARGRSALLGQKMTAAEVADASARGWVAILLGKLSSHAIQLLTLVVIARLLAPSDFGVLTMVMAVIGIANIFQDLGLAAAIVREPVLQHSQVNTVFWINLSMGCAMTLAGCLAAPAIRTFYDDARVEQVALALSFNFLIGALGAQQFALLRRNLRFRELARTSVAATMLGNVVALICAWRGAHYWALVASTLSSSTFSTLVAWRLTGWRPSLPQFDPSVRRMLSFGGYLVVFALLRYAGTNVQNILLGRTINSAAVGHFNRGFQLLQLTEGYVVDPIDLTARTAMSKMLDDAPAFSDYYLRQASLLCALAAPIGFCTTVLAGDIIAVLFGPAWTSSAQVLRIVGYGVIARVLCVSTGWVFVARGDSRRMMRWGVVGWGALIACLLMAAPYGIEGMAWAYTASIWLLLVPCLAYAFRGTSLRVADVARRLMPIVAAGGLACAGLYLLWLMLAPLPALARLPLCGTVYLALYAGLLAWPFGQRQLFR
ncbi:MAG TPA: lipopolysaccharide biosynthesis protein, partial [Nevskiaceae bacterium]|nr:lipopolysaccharide biosynthesis protein [Nevskiaceae bacterium]